MSDELPAGSRGFTFHQRVSLEVDFAGVLYGTAHLTIHPTTPALRTVYLHASPRLQINSVTLSSPTDTFPLLATPASFAHSNPFQPFPPRENPIEGLKNHPEIKRRTWAAMGERDEGELAISVKNGWVRVIETAGAGPNGGIGISLAPIQIQIDYQLVLGGEVVEGIVFRRPGDGGDDTQIPHMFLSPTSYDAARIWTPCVDNLWERCTWELEIIVPQYIEGGQPEGNDDAYPVMVVASGELIEQVTHPHDPHKVIFYFIQTNPASVQHITFAAGPFEMCQVSVPAGESQKPMFAFGLPGELDLLTNSTSFLSRAMTFYTTEFGSYPFTAFKMVFVSDPRAQCTTSATLAILSSDLLHPATVIDQAIETRRILSLALIQQWIGVNIIQRSWADTWLIVGLGLYIHSLFLRHLFGNNEYRFRLKKDIERCARMDQGDQWPICVPGSLDPPDAAAMSFISLKAPLVLHILDRHLTKAGTSLGLSRVIPKIFLDSLSDELSGNLLSTQLFFRICRRISGMDLTSFQDLWIYGSGCPHITIKSSFSRKKFTVELAVQQSVPAMNALENSLPKEKSQNAWKRPVPFFEASLTVRIHEADGAPFEHVIDLKQPFKVFQLPFNTKYKRTRRSGHVAARFNKLQDALQAVEENDPDDAEQLRDVDRAEVFAYPPWENEEERKKWRVADWTEEEAVAMLGDGGGGGYEWIRIDPDCEWIATFDFQEKPWFWISQLQGDRDVVAQLEAIRHMTLYPSPVIASELARVVLVENYYYRVRMAAVRALVVFNTADVDYMGHFLLLKLFQMFYCHPTEEAVDPLTMKCLPKPNDFSNFADYFLKKSMIAALSELRDPVSRMVWRNVRRLLLDIVKLNDNMTNKFSDSHYLASAIAAMSNAFMLNNPNLSEEERKADMALLREAEEVIDRAITVDRLVPSFHNVVTIAGLQAQMKAVLVGQKTNDVRTFLSYTREGNYEPVRLIAFDCLLLCKAPGRSQTLARYLFDVIQNDYSLTVRRHVARALHEAVLMTLVVGDIYVPASAGVVEMNEEGIDAKEKARADEHSRIVKALRKEYGGKFDLVQLANRALLSSFTGMDNEILLSLLKFAEVVSKSDPEPSGSIITLPTPSVEVPTPTSVTPRLRLSMSAGVTDAEDYFQRPLSSATSMTPGTQALQRITFTLPSLPGQEKKKKKKNVPKAQSRGLPEDDMKAINIVLQKMETNPKSRFFLNPVDPVRDNAPDYLSVIKTPMDLSTIRAKFENGMYATRQEFLDDVQLIFTNCYLYNSPASPVHKQGEQFEKFFKSTWTKMENTLNKAAQPAHTPAHISAPPTLIPGPASTASGGRSGTLMPPPPVPTPGGGTTNPSIPGPSGGNVVGTGTGPVKLKIKSTSGATTAASTSPHRAKGASGGIGGPMPPPPVPPTRKLSIGHAGSPSTLVIPQIGSGGSSTLKEKGETEKGKNNEKEKVKEEKEKGKEKEKEKDKAKEKEKDKDKEKEKEKTKRRRESKTKQASDGIDDLLGEEVDAIDRRSSAVAADVDFDDLLNATTTTATIQSNPAPKKIKLSRHVDDSPSTISATTPSLPAVPPKAIKNAPMSIKKDKTDSQSQQLATGNVKSPSEGNQQSASLMSVAVGDAKTQPPKKIKAKTIVTGSSDLSTQPQSSNKKATTPAQTTKITFNQPSSSSPLPPASKSTTPSIAPPQPISLSSSSSLIPLPSTATLIHASPPSPPPDLPPTVQNTMPFRSKRAKTLLNVLVKDISSFLFRQPVDPIRDGCPTYLDEIKEPMDFGTIGKKIEMKSESKRYKTMGEFARDIELIYANCRQFNPPGPITDAADANEALYWREWPKAVNPRMNADEKKAMQALIKTAFTNESSFLFHTPVDPVALGIPTYFEIIPQDDARDLSLIKSKLEKNKYPSAAKVDEDIELMLENCRVFNGDGEISDIANKFGEWWKKQREKMDF